MIQWLYKYRKIIYDAQVYANAGGTTYEKAVDMATHDFLSAGINCVEYKNGARHTIADYADMAIRTANKRAYLRGEGTKRAEWGIHTVIVNKRGHACPLCAPFAGKVLIDDVYSGGSSKDGDYMLLSTAMAEGFLHPRCRDGYTTYFEDISTPPEEEKPTKAEEEAISEKARLEQKKAYAENQASRMERLSKYSLDSGNKKTYGARAEQWQKSAEEIGEKLNNSVANSGESGIIKHKEKTSKVNQTKAKIPVDKKAIDYSKTGSNIFSQKVKTELYQSERIISGNSYETAILYNSNGERTLIKKGKKDRVTFTKSEVSKMKNGVLTHNHPNGTVFSPDDINMLRRGKLSEIRACNSRGTYVLRNASKWDDSIPDYTSIKDEYWNIMNEIDVKYRDLSAKEGKPISSYFRQMDEEGLNVFCERHGLEFAWEGKK